VSNLFEEDASNPVLMINSLKVYFRTKNGYVRAADEVSTFVNEGGVTGLAGESGSGKSTVVSQVFRILPKNGEYLGGKVLFKNRDIMNMDLKEFSKDIRWKRMSLIPQASMDALDPVYRVKDQMLETILEHEDMSKAEALERIYKSLESVGVPQEKADMFPHELSGGQRQRVIIAMALLLNPDLVIADEPTTALDVITQAQIISLLKGLQQSRGFSMMMVTHDLSLLASMSDMVTIMYAGKVVELGGVDRIYSTPLHPYTQLLIKAIPDVKRGRERKLISIPGYPPDLIDPPKGCRFHPRCPLAMPICKEKEPELVRVEPRHYVACHVTGVRP
jgi:peptide/nickel transport system ATP-binding protein